MISGEIAHDRVRDVVAGAAEIDVAVEFRLHELMAGIGIDVRTQLVAATPHRRHAGAVPAVKCVVGDERRVHYALVFVIIRIGQLVAIIAFDAVGVAGCQT